MLDSMAVLCLHDIMFVPQHVHAAVSLTHCSRPVLELHGRLPVQRRVHVQVLTSSHWH